MSGIVFWRGGFYEFTGCHYRELPEGDLRARITGFIRSREWMDRKGAVTRPSPKATFVRDVALNVAAKAPVPSYCEPPLWEDGTPAPQVLVFENGVLDVDEFFRGFEDTANHEGTKDAKDGEEMATETTKGEG